MIIYVLTQGEYSDYHIVGVFTDKEKADEIQLKIGDSCVEEYDTEQFNAIPKGMLPYQCIMQRDGTCYYCHLNIYEYSLDGIGTYEIGEHGLTFYCFARSVEHAIKITNEKRAQLIAMGEWK